MLAWRHSSCQQDCRVAAHGQFVSLVPDGDRYAVRLRHERGSFALLGCEPHGHGAAIPPGDPGRDLPDQA